MEELKKVSENLGIGIFVLYKKLIVNQNVNDVLSDIKTSFTNTNQFVLMILAFSLVPINIFLEGIKWKLQLGNIVASGVCAIHSLKADIT